MAKSTDLERLTNRARMPVHKVEGEDALGTTTDREGLGRVAVGAHSQ